MNNKGMSYLEVLIAAALVSIFLLPVISGFHSATVQYQHAYLVYQATLLGQNLLVETEQALLRGGNEGLLTAEGMEEWIGNSSFAKEYQTDLFEYRVAVQTLDGEAVVGETIFGSEVLGDVVYRQGLSEDLGEWVADERISFENNTFAETGGFATYDGTRCKIVVPDDSEDDFTIQCVVDAPLEIDLVNETNRRIQVHLFAEPECIEFTYFSPNGQVIVSEYSVRNEQTFLVLIELTYFSPNGQVIVSEYSVRNEQTFLVLIEIFDVKRERLLNQMTKLVYRE